MGKDSKHPWSGSRIIFATKHEKEKILEPLFLELGFFLLASKSETDLLGTFSGEIERKASVRETLREKIKMAMNEFPEDRFFLASEGSFGPHPFIGFSQTDLESLLLFDKVSNAEIYAEFLSSEVVHDKREFSPGDSFSLYLKQIYFPNHGVMVHPADSLKPIFKGLHEERQVAQAMLESFMTSKNGKAIIATDLRALHSPSRQKAIYEAGKKLIQHLKSYCPDCGYPGFCVVRVVRGLPCSDCGEPSQITKDIVYACASCKFERTQPRPDGLNRIGPEECEFCNP